MDFEFENGTLTALLDDPRQLLPHRVKLNSICSLPRQDIERLAQATRKFFSGKSHRTQANSLIFAFSRFGQYVSQRKLLSLPDTFNTWQFLLLDWFAWYLSHKGSDASLETRVKYWDYIVIPWLKGLTNEGVMPYGLVLPSARFRAETVRTGSPKRPSLMGEKPAQPTLTEKPINKTLAGPVFWRNDIDYLNEVETTLRQRNNLLARVADDHWLRLIKDYRHGRNFLRRVSEEALKDRIAKNHWKTKVPVNTTRYSVKSLKVTAPRVPDGACWALRIMMHSLMTSDDAYCLEVKKLQRHPAILCNFLGAIDDTPILPLRNKTSLCPAQWKQLEDRSLFMRFLGVLLPVDMAVACTILIQEHPNFNPMSLMEARLLNARGKQSLIVTDNDNRSIFSVDKPRAGTRKYAPLSRRAQRVVRHLLRATAPVRDLLKRAGSKHWRNLFLGYSGANISSLGYPRISPRYLWHPYYVSLARLYPELEEGGLGKGTLSFTKIRTTQGVLEWFDTGSVHKASRKLGNSQRIVLEHYIPPPLLHLWNERIIRRFQNTLIVLAAHDEEYLLDVTDLRDFSELQEFVSQLLLEYPDGSSPIANAAHQKFRVLGGDNLLKLNNHDAVVTSGAILSVRINGDALALLYAFQHITTSRLSPKAIQQADPRTGLVPKHFVDLAALLSHAAENDSVSEALGETLELAKLKRAHVSAQNKVPKLLERLEHIYISPVWSL